MRKLIIAASLLAATPALAIATGDCTTQSGTKIKYAISSGSGHIFYNGDGPYEVYTELRNNLGIINQIGNRGNMRMAVDLKTGRGYIVTRFDDGRVVEGNLVCLLDHRD